MNHPISAAATTPSLLGRLRIAIRVAAMVLLLIACIPAYYLWRPFTNHNPWPGIFLGGITRIAGVDVRIAGRRMITRRMAGGEFLLANHVSWIDIPAIASAAGAAFVAHDGLASVPLLRWLCDLNDTVFVARHDRSSVAQQVADVREAIRDTGALAIFPEGTTSDGTDLLPFKSALLSALDPVPEGIIVQPLWLDYGPRTSEIAWVGDEPGLVNFWRILADPRPITLTVHFLPPLEGEALANRKTMAVVARNAILQAMQSAREPSGRRAGV